MSERSRAQYYCASTASADSCRPFDQNRPSKSFLESFHVDNLWYSVRHTRIESIRPSQRQRRLYRLTMTKTTLLLVTFVTMSLLPTISGASPPDYLDNHSMVLITGAAGFIGSELAMALHRVYQPKMIVCIDAMDNLSKTRTEEDLALLEYKRQRAFRVMQTLGSKGVFYRADFRPSIPEYFDVGEVPILDYIFREYAITHIVHLADAHHRGNNNVQAVPRIKEDIKAGMMESLLEQIVKMNKETGRMPQLTYASSYEVYNFWNPTVDDPNPPPFHESKPITTPSSLRGASKLIDEILGRAYYDKHQIYSLGLRFFPVYGPWGLPGTPLFEMAERAITDSSTPILTLAEKDALDDERDYVYIDDAVDAVMAAMQFRTTSGRPGVINVGSGRGTTLRDVARQMEKLLPRTVEVDDLGTPSKAATTAYASTERSSQILGFSPQVSLKEGLTRLLAWHYDRAFPQGGRPLKETENIASRGVASCSPFDKECLRGAPVYPCVSECSHEHQCKQSHYDEVLDLTRSLTSNCDSVLYTVALDEDLTVIPSANVALNPEAVSHMKNKACNVAFVSDASPLVRRLRKQYGLPAMPSVLEEFWKVPGNPNEKNMKLMQHGFWTLIPVSTPSFSTGDEHILKLVPKLSPGLFFGATTRHAIYCDSNVIFTSIPSLLEEAQMQPYLEGVAAATALLIGKDKDGWSKPRQTDSDESVQSAAYRMIQIGVIEEITSHPLLDTSWMVHTLRNEDSRLFRCDVFAEIIQWNVGTEKPAMEFIMGLHDMWSRVISNGKGQAPWWIGDDVMTVREGAEAIAEKKRRRLAAEGLMVGIEKQEEGQVEKTRKAEAAVENVADDGEQKKQDEAKVEIIVQNEIVQQVESEKVIGISKDVAETEGETQEEGEKKEIEEVEIVEEIEAVDDNNRREEQNEVAEANLWEEEKIEIEEHVGIVEEIKAGDDDNRSEDHNEAAEAKRLVALADVAEDKAGEDVNGIDAINEHEVEEGGAFMGADGDKNHPLSPGKTALAGEDGEDDETTLDEDSEQKVAREKVSKEDDTWMGVLSSTSIHYFVRIVPSSQVGVVFL